MLNRIRSEGADVVVASRIVAGGSMGEFTRSRTLLSHLGRKVSKLICHCEVADAMSGFFLVEARFFRTQVPRLTGTGFKILVDILASSKTPPRVIELPYRFRMRQAGESKLDTNVQLEYLYLIMDKLIGRWVPTRFALFLCVGALGVGAGGAVRRPAAAVCAGSDCSDAGGHDLELPAEQRGDVSQPEIAGTGTFERPAEVLPGVFVGSDHQSRFRQPTDATGSAVAGSGCLRDGNKLGMELWGEHCFDLAAHPAVGRRHSGNSFY